MAEVKSSKLGELQPNSKLGHSKDFLKLNMQKLRRLSKENETRRRDISPKAKKESPKKSARRNDTLNIGDTKRASAPANTSTRLKAGAITRIPNVNNPEIPNIVYKSPKKKERFHTSVVTDNTKKDQSVQSCNTSDEAFLRDAKILEPSAYIVEAIKLQRENQQKALRVQKLTAQARKHEKRSPNEEVHLDNLREFMERGSISRRRKNIEKRREEIQKKLGRYGIVTDSYSVPTSISNQIPQDLNYSPSTKFKYPSVNKLTKFPTAKEVGDGINEDPKRLVVVYQRD